MSSKGEASAGSAQYPVSEWCANVDWVTYVYPDVSSAERAIWRAEHWQQAEKARGNRVRPWSLASYRGSSCGGVAFGRMSGGGLVQVSSTRADAAFPILASLGGSPSRIDLALTCHLEPGVNSPALEAYHSTPDVKSVGRQVRAKTLIQSTGGGATCYVGSPTSEQRLRVYDKGAEEGSEAPGVKWRWELQLRRKRAVAYSDHVLAAPHRASAVASAVLGYVGRLGLRSPAIARPSSHVRGGPAVTDASNTMGWLVAGVRPAVARLLHIYPREIILQALGLAESLPVVSEVHSQEEGSNHGRW